MNIIQCLYYYLCMLRESTIILFVLYTYIVNYSLEYTYTVLLYTYTQVNIYTQVYTYTQVYIYTQVYTYIQVFTYTYILRIFVYTHLKDLKSTTMVLQFVLY